MTSTPTDAVIACQGGDGFCLNLQHKNARDYWKYIVLISWPFCRDTTTQPATHLMLSSGIPEIKGANMQHSSISHISTIHFDWCLLAGRIINIHDNSLFASKLM